MKTKFLAAAAIVLIGLSGAAWAQQTAPAAKADPAAEAAAQEAVVGQTSSDQKLPAEDAATSERMRSYSTSTTTAPFTGSVIGGMSADTLIGMNVVDSDGASVGKVSDLIIGQDDVVHHAIVEVGGFLGFGAKTTAIDLEHATVDQDKSEVTLDISRAQIDEMPAYQRDDDGWFAG